MPLEATMFCLDNSEWMRNGDLSPTRLRSLVAAVQSLASSYLRDNIESTTGFLTMADNKVDVQLSPCKNMGKMIKLLNELKPRGKCDIVTSLKIAQLTLKNRQNKNQRQRILLFVGSPVECSVEELVEVGKMLKKNNVSVDAVVFGAETIQSAEKIEALISTVNNQENSHVVVVPSGPHRLVDIVNSSALAIGGGARPSAATVGTNQAATFDELDLLMQTDPELAMALRLSLEDAGVPAPAAPAASTATTTPSKPIVTANASVYDDGMNDDDEELAAAIALSLQMEEEEAREREAAAAKKTEETAAATATTTKPTTNNVNTTVKEDTMNDDKLNDLLEQLANEDNANELTELLEQLGKDNKDKPAK